MITFSENRSSIKQLKNGIVMLTNSATAKWECQLSFGVKNGFQ